MHARLLTKPQTSAPTSVPSHNLTARPKAHNHESAAQDVSHTGAEAARRGHDFSQVRVHADEQPHQQHNSHTSLTMVEHHRESFSASIRRADTTRPSTFGGYYHAARERTAIKPVVGARYYDAMQGNEETSVLDLGALLAQTQSTPAISIPELQEGQTVRLPDIVFDQAIAESDPIASTLTYAPTVTQSGAAPAPFGETLPYTFAMSGITVTSAAGTFTVTATVDNPITFQVASGGKTDISSDTDADITQANYNTVASDLTPDMSDLNGRPPRTQFWAEDLCIRHERFHCTDGQTHARSGVTLAQNWLNTQTAATVADVNTLIGQVPARVIATRSAAMTFPGRENRAYGDGAPSYLARATAIKTKGDANGYAPPAPAPAPPAAPPRAPNPGP